LTSDSTPHSPAPADSNFLPGPVLLLGAPGVGKGTQAQLLMAKFGIPQISTGDLLRQHVRNGTELGKAAKQLMDQGQLVPDKLVEDMVALRLCQDDVHSGYILDGFPRTGSQASWIDAQSSMYRNTPPLIAVSIEVEESELLKRITGRRTCPTCNRIYNIYLNPPINEGICDVDNSNLIQRADDTEEAFARRMRAYEASTAPVIEHYRQVGRCKSVDGQAPVAEVHSRILTALKELRKSFPPGTWNSQAGV
jgi:adenylate kinase